MDPWSRRNAEYFSCSKTCLCSAPSSLSPLPKPRASTAHFTIAIVLPFPGWATAFLSATTVTSHFITFLHRTDGAFFLKLKFVAILCPTSLLGPLFPTAFIHFIFLRCNFGNSRSISNIFIIVFVVTICDHWSFMSPLWLVHHNPGPYICCVCLVCSTFQPFSHLIASPWASLSLKTQQYCNQASEQSYNGLSVFKWKEELNVYNFKSKAGND